MIAPGNLYMERDAPRPRVFQAQDDAHQSGWVPVKLNTTSRELDTELSKFGWTFFFMANVIRKSALAVDRDKGITAALKRVIAQVREDGCNSLQIEAIEAHSWFGISRVTVSAHPRHLQKGLSFSPHSKPHGAAAEPLELSPKKIVI